MLFAQTGSTYRTLRIHGRRQYREQTIRGKLGSRGAPIKLYTCGLEGNLTQED